MHCIKVFSVGPGFLLNFLLIQPKEAEEKPKQGDQNGLMEYIDPQSMPSDELQPRKTGGVKPLGSLPFFDPAAQIIACKEEEKPRDQRVIV